MSETLEIPSDIADYVVCCPVGKGGGQGQRIADFAQTEEGQRFLPNAIENIRGIEAEGVSREKAIALGLSAVALKDEQGNFVTNEDPAKKKLSKIVIS